MKCPFCSSEDTKVVDAKTFPKLFFKRKYTF